ncbi:MAG: hypothetical protein P4L36_20670 [Holophaga sp.]|nr:hypothetical protein [Holophaga sp.]
MRMRSLALTLLTGLFAVHGAFLLAQAKETAVDKERRKGLTITNNSTDPWQVGVDPATTMNGEIEILELNAAQTGFNKKGKLKGTAKLTIAPDGEILLSPVPPRKWFGLVKTGVDFSGKFYLQDARNGKLSFTMERASKGKTDDKTCYFTFAPDFEAFRYEAVLSLTPGEGAFANKYVNPIHIIGVRLPPPKGKTNKSE